MNLRVIMGLSHYNVCRRPKSEIFLKTLAQKAYKEISIQQLDMTHCLHDPTSVLRSQNKRSTLRAAQKVLGQCNSIE